MKKTILLAAAMLPVALFAQNDQIQVRGKGEGCNGMGRGCVPTLIQDKNGVISLDIQEKQNNKVILSVPVKNLSEEEQIYLTGYTLNKIQDEVFFVQEGDYYFSDEEKRILDFGGNIYLKQGKYPIRISEDKLFIELIISEKD